MEISTQPTALDVAVDVYGQSFTFHLQRRPIPLGNLTVQYYWMDSSELRKGATASDKGFENLTRCISLWWRHVRSQNKQDEQEVLWYYLLANCYPLVAKSHGQQRIYRGAFADKIKRRYDIEYPFELPLSDVTSETVGDKLRSILCGELLTKEEQEYALVNISGILDFGVAGIRQDYWLGLEEFLGKFESWWESRRKRGKKSPESIRTLDTTAYLSKLAFCECYSNAWIAIIEQLERQKLDDSSISFLRFMHFQNVNEMPRGGPPGPLGGLILALHPLFTYLEQEPRLAAACGEFFQEIKPRDIDEGCFEDWLSYRKFLGAITLAAMQYRQDLDRRKEERHPFYELTDEQTTPDELNKEDD